MSWLLTALDFVPVVGSLKNVIEAGIAVYDGNNDEAFIKGTEALVGGTLDVLTLGFGGCAAKVIVKGMTKGGTKAIAKVIVKETAGYALANVMVRVAANKKPSANPQTMGGSAGKPPPPGGNEKLNPEKIIFSKKKKLINNDVLTAIREIIDLFLEIEIGNVTIQNLVEHGIFDDESPIVMAYNQPLTDTVRESIESMEARVDIDHPDININELSFANALNNLQNIVYLYMHDIFNFSEGGLVNRQLVIRTGNDFATPSLFVRQYAVDIWREIGRDLNPYVTASDAVVDMFQNLEANARRWAIDLRTAARDPENRVQLERLRVNGAFE